MTLVRTKVASILTMGKYGKFGRASLVDLNCGNNRVTLREFAKRFNYVVVTLGLEPLSRHVREDIALTKARQHAERCIVIDMRPLK